MMHLLFLKLFPQQVIFMRSFPTWIFYEGYNFSLHFSLFSFLFLLLLQVQNLILIVSCCLSTCNFFLSLGTLKCSIFFTMASHSFLKHFSTMYVYDLEKGTALTYNLRKLISPSFSYLLFTIQFYKINTSPQIAIYINSLTSKILPKLNILYFLKQTIHQP